MSTPEGDVKNAILEWLSFQPRCFVWPNASVGVFDPVRKVYRKPNSKYHINGVSDILGIWNGRPLAIEVKRKKGPRGGLNGSVVSEDQEKFIKKFNAHGGIAFVAHSWQEAKTLLHERASRLEEESNQKP